ncbi:MAG: helix-hairpin-helix domain-containing protein [Chloroflexi bacterium]|nr:helix-hairpin-helix domain-containing protein [Chloroflexota bacterium]
MAGWWERQRTTIGVALLAALVAAGLTLWLARPEPPPLRVIQPTSVPTPSEIVVHVSGAVAAPGVYRLPTTARVLDGLEAAGGATAEANPQALNLAARLRDGQQVVVPERGERVAAPERPERTATPERGPTDSAEARPAPPAGPIDLNRADAAQLDSLPGIGAVTARRILEYRERVGRFERVDQLLEARLVNRPTFERIKDLVTVE